MNRGTRGKATASIESQFVELVRKWVEMHPLRGDVLSVADIQVAAAKIMLKQGKRNWRLGANARLGAILLVLFVHEGLEVGGGGSGEGEPYILGVPMSEVYEMLECVISEAGLTKRVLLDNVAEVDTIGSTACLVQTMELSAALFPSEALPAASPVRMPSLSASGSGRSKKATSAEVHASLAALPYVESADLSSDIPGFLQMPLRQKLSLSFTRQRAFLRSLWAGCAAARELIFVGELLFVTAGFVTAYWMTCHATQVVSCVTLIVVAVTCYFSLLPFAIVMQQQPATNDNLDGGGTSKKATPAEVHASLAALPYVESADLSSDIPGFLQIPLRQKLSQSFTRQRALLALLTLSTTSLSPLFGEWDFAWQAVHGLSLDSLPRDSRLALYVASVYSTSLFVAALFPNDMSSKAGAQFQLPVVVGSTLRCVGVVLDVYHTGPLVNPACTAVHRLTSVVLFLAWLSAPVRSWAGRFDWYWGRCIHMTEGVALVTCTLLIRALGPSEHYPPGGMSLSAALARGGLAIVLGGLVLSPPNRRHLARLANHFGVNHVVLSLNDVDLNPINRRDAYGEIRPPSIPAPPSQSQGGGEEDMSGSSLTYSRAASHHTTKMPTPAFVCYAVEPPPAAQGGADEDMSGSSRYTSKMPPGAHYWVEPPP